MGMGMPKTRGCPKRCDTGTICIFSYPLWQIREGAAYIFYWAHSPQIGEDWTEGKGEKCDREIPLRFSSFRCPPVPWPYRRLLPPKLHPHARGPWEQVWSQRSCSEALKKRSCKLTLWLLAVGWLPQALWPWSLTVILGNMWPWRMHK